MQVRIVLTEASPDTLWTHGEVKNVSAPGTPTVGLADAMLKKGSSFPTQPGTHTYRFLIHGNGTLKMQAINADSGQAIALAQPFDTTTDGHGALTYEFQVA